MFAAGSGITPMMAMLRYIDDLCLDTEVILFYSVRTRQDIIFESELQRLGRQLHKFQCVVTLTRPDENWKGPAGHLSRNLVSTYLDGNNDGEFFLCGPGAFMSHVRGILTAIGIDPKSIRQEQFGGKPTAIEAGAGPDEPDGVAEFAKSRRTCTFSSKRSLLEVAEQNGVDIPYSCRHGQCGTCATRLLKGEVQMDCEDGLNPALKAQGYVLPCVGHARGDVRLDA